MLDYQVDYVDALTRLNARDQARLTRWYATKSEPVRIKAHELQRKWATQWSNEARSGSAPAGFTRTNAAENWYAALLVALQYLWRLEQASSRGRNLQEDELELAAELQTERAKMPRGAPPNVGKKRRAVLVRLPLIMQLRDAGLSWREIAKHKEFSGMTAAWIHEVVKQENAKQSQATSLERTLD